MDQEANGHLHLYPGSRKLVATECWNSDVAGQNEDFDKLIYYLFLFFFIMSMGRQNGITMTGELTVQALE